MRLLILLSVTFLSLEVSAQGKIEIIPGRSITGIDVIIDSTNIDIFLAGTSTKYTVQNDGHWLHYTSQDTTIKLSLP